MHETMEEGYEKQSTKVLHKVQMDIVLFSKYVWAQCGSFILHPFYIGRLNAKRQTGHDIRRIHVRLLMRWSKLTIYGTRLASGKELRLLRAIETWVRGDFILMHNTTSEAELRNGDATCTAFGVNGFA
jgi:hypothetical protein